MTETREPYEVDNPVARMPPTSTRAVRIVDEEEYRRLRRIASAAEDWVRADRTRIEAEHIAGPTRRGYSRMAQAQARAQKAWDLFRRVVEEEMCG